jgi:hypothetical protein
MNKRLILEVVVLTTIIAIGTTALESNPISFGVTSTELVLKTKTH